MTANAKTFVLGLLSGLLITGCAFAGYTYVSDRLEWGVSLTPDDKVNAIYDMLEAHSINAYDKDKLLEDMYRGMLAGVGDPYTYYFDKKAYGNFTEQTEGAYVGVGIVVQIDPADMTVTLVTVYPGTPAEKAGMLVGDKIIKVNGGDVIGKAMEEVTALIKGHAGTTVNITVRRKTEDATEDVTMDVYRESISIPTVSHRMLEGVIGYIRIDQFDRVTLSQFTAALEELRGQQMRGLIIDVRNNPGGLLNTVTDIADILLPEGVITYTEDKGGEKKYYNSDESALDLPMVLLVNGNSASASEVLCGAVRDMGRGVLVGEKTFGKGIVQNLYELSDGSAIKVTVAKYYTPNGICIQGEGITPDYPVEMDGQWSAQLDEAEDAQLQKAIDVMWGQLASLS
jgi:carboxyl-terminal processing protease